MSERWAQAIATTIAIMTAIALSIGLAHLLN
jgi:hypothetical protein